MIEIITDNGTALDLAPDVEFTIEMENPLLSDDLMPVPFSTSIAFLPTPGNMAAFGYIGAMMLEPSVKAMPVTIFAAGMPVIKGSLLYDGIEDGKLNYTFAGKNIDDALTGNISETTELTKTDNSTDTLKMIIASRTGDRSLDFGTPMLVNTQQTGKIDTPGENQEVEPDVKFKNYTHKTIDTPFAPAIKVSAILNGKISPDKLPEPSQKLYDSLAVLGLYSTEDSVNGYPLDNGGTPCINLADKLPECTVKDFVSNILKILCASVWADHDSLYLRQNSDILECDEYDDWNGKISDIYSIGYNDGEKYSFAYADDESQDIYDPNLNTQTPVDTYMGVWDLISAFGSDNNAIIRDSDTKDVFCVDKRYQLADSIFRYNGESCKLPDESSDNRKEVKSDFHLVRCIPVNCRQYDTQHIGKILMCPRIDCPALDGERPKDVHIGILSHNQLTDKGQIPYGSQLYEDDFIDTDYPPECHPNFKTGLSIIPGDLMSGPHKVYSNWISRRKQIIKADLNLSISDISSLKLYKKVYFYGRYWLIKKITCTYLSDRVECNGEFASI